MTMTCKPCCELQYEACQEALQLLESTPDAQGRKLQVYKVQLPPNLFLCQEEASALVVRNPSSFLRCLRSFAAVHNSCTLPNNARPGFIVSILHSSMRSLKYQALTNECNTIQRLDIEMRSPSIEVCETCIQGEKLKRNAGDRLPASYINFYRGNGCAVIPAFREATDEP